MHVQSCCFVNLNLLLFCRSRWRRLRLYLSFLLFISHLTLLVHIILWDSISVLYVVAALTKKWNESFSFINLILFTFFLSSKILLFSLGPLVINRYINSCKNSYLSKSLHQSPVLVHRVMWHHSHVLLWFHSPPWSWNHECLDQENKVVWILSSRSNSSKLWFSLSSDSLDVKLKKIHVSTGL